MSVLEREILEKYNQLDTDAQERVKDAIVRGVSLEPGNDKKTFDLNAWLESVEELRAGIRADNDGKWPIAVGSSVEILRQIRNGDDEWW